jgi:hypothetical protein
LAYIGKNPINGNFVKLDAITTSATATYNLLNGGVAYFPQTANNCIVSLNGVIQSPTSAYTISGSTIVFDSALTASDSIDFILVLGDVLNIGTPSDSTVGFAKVTSNLITGATAVTVPATDDVLLCYDTSATALRKITFADFGNTPAFEASLSAQQNVANNTDVKAQCNTENFDTDGAYDNATNYRFTPQVAGKYFVYGQIAANHTTIYLKHTQSQIKKNGTQVKMSRLFSNSGDVMANNVPVVCIVDMNGTTDYLELFGFLVSASGQNIFQATETYFGAYRLTGV